MLIVSALAALTLLLWIYRPFSNDENSSSASPDKSTSANVEAQPASDPPDPLAVMITPTECRELLEERYSEVPTQPAASAPENVQKAYEKELERPRIPPGQRPVFNDLCRGLVELQNAHREADKKFSALNSRTGLPISLAWTLLAGILGGLAGWLLSRRAPAERPSAAPPSAGEDPAARSRDVTKSGPAQPPFDYEGLVAGMKRLDKVQAEMSSEHYNLSQRLDSIQRRFESLAATGSAARPMSDNLAADISSDSGLAPPRPVPGAGDIRKDYIVDAPPAVPFAANADPGPAPVAAAVRAEDFFPDADAMVAAYRELIARPVVSQSDYDSTLAQFGELAAVELDAGRLTLGSGYGPGDVEKKLLAVVDGNRGAAMLFPSRTYCKNFPVNFSDRSQAGQEIVAAFDLEVDGSGSLGYRLPALARIRADSGLDIARKGRLGGYTA